MINRAIAHLLEIGQINVSHVTLRNSRLSASYNGLRRKILTYATGNLKSGLGFSSVAVCFKELRNNESRRKFYE